MILAALDRLESAHEALILALDSGEIDAIDRAVELMGTAAAELRATPGAREPLLLERIRELALLSDAARIRVGFLTDLNRRRIDTLAAARGEALGGCYGRDGRRAA